MHHTKREEELQDLLEIAKIQNEFLESRLKRLEQDYTHIDEELKEFKETTAFFLNDFLTNLDNIMPTDLEYGLLEFEKRTIDYSTKDYDKNLIIWAEVLDLCNQLGHKPIDGYSILQSVKIFIKTIVRSNTLLEKENTKQALLIQENETQFQNLLDKIKF